MDNAKCKVLFHGGPGFHYFDREKLKEKFHLDKNTKILFNFGLLLAGKGLDTAVSGYGDIFRN